MRSDGHLSTAPSMVRNRPLQQYRALRLDNGRAWLMLGGQGVPRLWSYAMDAAARGFESGLGSSGGTRLEAAFDHARRELIHAVGYLVERTAPDISLTGLLLQAGHLYVAHAGEGRVYLYRRGQPERLTPRDAPKGGLLVEEVARRKVLLDPGDILLAGNENAFSTQSVGRVAQVLQQDPSTPAAVLATLLTEPARKAGVGAAAIALRVR